MRFPGDRLTNAEWQNHPGMLLGMDKNSTSLCLVRNAPTWQRAILYVLCLPHWIWVNLKPWCGNENSNCSQRSKYSNNCCCCCSLFKGGVRAIHTLMHLLDDDDDDDGWLTALCGARIRYIREIRNRDSTVPKIETIPLNLLACSLLISMLVFQWVLFENVTHIAQWCFDFVECTRKGIFFN